MKFLSFRFTCNGVWPFDQTKFNGYHMQIYCGVGTILFIVVSNLS
ncbi:hypothetical protein [Sporocytophaga sp.]|nr:hypothetical protein [Sporocytophaga sp.]